MSHEPAQPIKLQVVTVQEVIRLDVIELLEDYLELAKAGQINAVALVALKPDDMVAYGYSAVRGKLTMLGGADMLMRLIRKDVAHYIVEDGDIGADFDAE